MVALAVIVVVVVVVVVVKRSSNIGSNAMYHSSGIMI